MEVKSFDEMTPDWLAAAPSGALFRSVHLPYGSEDADDWLWPPPPALPRLIVSALASSTSTLVELDDLPLVKPASHHRQAAGLAALTRLRLQTLRQAWPMEALPSTLLPASLEDISLCC